MTRLLRFGNWNLRQSSESRDSAGPGPAAANEPRPEIARGKLTSFRRFRAVDAVDLIRWGKHSDPLLESYTMDLRTVENAHRWFNVRQSWTDSQLYAIDSLAERRVIGYIGLREIDLTRRTSVLGISFDPNSMGRGYGTDALKTFLCCYFETWMYSAMFLDVAATNSRAQRCYEHCGFQYVGERWKPFSGNIRKALRTSEYMEHPEFFHYSGRNLTMLFYDLWITHARWLAMREI